MKLKSYHIFVLLAIIFTLLILLYILQNNRKYESFDVQKKHVRHLFNSKTQGIGDFIRGSLTIAKICKAHGYTFDVDYEDNGISRYLYNTSKRSDISTDKSNIINIEQKVYEYNELEGIIISKLNNSSSGILFLGTCIPHRTLPIDDDIREYLKNSFLPNDELKNAVNDMKRNLLGNESTQYTMIHARIGDNVLVDNTIVGIDVYESARMKIKTQVEQLTTKRPTIAISDDVNFKNYLHEKDGYILMPTKPKHTKDSDDIKDTMIDFFMLCGASEIVQHSQYYWGSGFSDRASDLYNIPIFKTKPDTH